MISLMVGLVISMIVCVGLMVVFRNAVKVATDSKTYSTNDNQMNSSLVSAGMLVQEAGYGISSPTLGTHLVMVSGVTCTGSGSSSGSGASACSGASSCACSSTGSSSSSSSSSGSSSSGSGGVTTGANMVVWTTLNGATTQCAGLYAPSSGGLVYLQPVSCTSAANPTSLNWTSTTVLAAQSAAKLSFSVVQNSCAPYGITATTGNYLLSISTTSASGQAISASQCLLNFH